MKKNLSILIPFISIIILFSSPAICQEGQFEIKSSPNIVGSGARALGVGGAFIAIADDGTAASWNPAALTILRRPEAAIMLSYEKRDRNGDANFFDFNYVAASYPFNFLDRNMVVSFNYQRLMDFNSQLDMALSNIDLGNYMGRMIFEGDYIDPGNPSLNPADPWPINSVNTGEINGDFSLDNEVTGDLGAIAPAFAIQITPKIALGITMNLWVDGLINDGYEQTYHENQDGYTRFKKLMWVDVDGDGEIDSYDNDIEDWDNDGDGWLGPGDDEYSVMESDKKRFKSETTIETEYDFFGINANLGLLVKATKNLTVGAVYKLPFTAKVDVTRKLDSYQKREDGSGGWVRDHSVNTYETLYKITFPATYGLGGAWRFNDNFTMALDLAYIAWQNFVIQEYVNVDEKTDTGLGGEYRTAGKRVSAVNGLRTSDADISGVITARLGAEYMFILPKTIIPARLGFIYDPQPAQGSPDDFYSITAGTGAVLFEKLVFDVAYQYRWAKDATVATITTGDGVLHMEVTDDVKQHIVMFSTIYYF